MMRNILYFAVALLQASLFVHGTGLYTVVGPGTIRSNFKYNVAVTLHEAEKPGKVQVGITGPSYNKTETVELEPMTTKNVEFDVPKLKSGDYNLTTKGLDDLKFENSTKLQYSDYEPSIYIQTDKATYKPGDLVKYRIIFLDENTRPAKIDKKISIIISDGAKNQIKLINDVKPTKGVYSGELQLSEQPVLGKWGINVNLDSEEATSKNFEVDKYVLPKFDVTIDTATDVAIPDGIISATIRSKYTYGKPVKGKALVSIEPQYHYYGGELKASKTIPVDGKGHVEFDLEKDLTLSKNSYNPPLNIKVVMTEDLTGKTYNASKAITLHTNRYRIEGVDTPETFKIDEPVKVTIVVKNVDGSPVQNKKNKKATLSVDKYSHWWNNDRSETEERSSEYEAPLNENGMATFEFTLKESDRNYYFLKATFEDTISSLRSIRKFSPEEKKTDEVRDLLKIDNITEKPHLGKDVSFEIKSREPLTYFIYTIVARGNIIKMEHIKVKDGQKSHKVKFTPTFEMIPRARLFVFFVHNKDLIFQEASLDFEKDFENSIDIKTPLQAKPGEEVELKVETDPDSFVGLLGVDQSVLLLKSGNDFDKDDIINKLSNFDSSTPYIRGYGAYPGRDAGLVTMTNANFEFNEIVFPHVPLYLAFNTPVFDVFGGAPLLGGRPGIPGPLPFLQNSVAAQMRPVGLSGSTGMRKPAVPEIRKDFSENWIFIDQQATDKDGFTLKKKIPDTITSWVVSGFSLNPKSGFALTKNPSKIRVFQPFFVATNLPYSVKRGELIAIPVIIFNYMEQDLETEVTMDNLDKDYEFIEATNEIEENYINEIKRTKRLTVPANSGQSVSFMIKPTRVGDITLKITAISPLAGDAIHKKLKVEPEGVPQYANKAIFLTLKDKKEHTGQFEVAVPPEIVPASEYIELSAVGDILGPTLKNLDKLVRMPYGCGEQNMVNFVPNILVLKYLEATGKKMPNIEEKAKKFVEVGYQRELTYKHDDGSYSAFGKSDKAGSTWLTAYVIREFHRAKPYTNIDSKVIKQGFDFLISKQADNGSFPEYGKLFDNSHQNEVGLTSFVLIALLENFEIADDYQDKTGKAADFIAENIEKEEDLYSMSLAYIALQMRKHPAAKKLLARMESLAKEENGLKWWSKEKKEETKKDPWYYAPKTNDVEITSYIFLGLLPEKPVEDLLPIVKWLISQRNSNGGFSSTQDTVTGLYALSSFAHLSGSGQGSMKISFTSSGGADDSGSFDISPENSLVLQSHVLPKATRQVDFKAEGSGSSLLQLSYRYNIADKDKKPSFAVTIKVHDSPKKLLNVDICTKYVPAEDNETKESNMAVLEIALPSGFTADADGFFDILAVDQVKRTETKNSDSTVIVYFDSLDSESIKCIPVSATKTHSVAKQKPASVSVYDYYDPSRRATEYYEKVSSPCDICEGDDCGAGCKK